MAPSIDYKQARVGLELKHPSPLIGCRFDPAGRYLFVSAQDNTLQRYDLLTGRKTALTGHASWVRGMAFVPGRGDVDSRPRPAAAADVRGGIASRPRRRSRRPSPSSPATTTASSSGGPGAAITPTPAAPSTPTTAGCGP